MKKTKFSRILSMLLALLMLSGTFVAMPVAAAEDDELGAEAGGNITADALNEALNATGYETYLSSVVASLRYDPGSRPRILLGAYRDGLNKEQNKAGVLHTIVQELVADGSISPVDVDSESAVLALDEATKTKIIVKLTDEQVTRYLRGTSAITSIDVMDYTAKDDDGKTRPAVDADFAVAGDYKQSVYLSDSGTVTWKFHLTEEEAGFYNIRMQYYPVEGNVSTIQRMMYVDGSVLFAEARSLSFAKIWKYDYNDGNGNGIADYKEGLHAFRQDKNKNDLRPDSAQAPTWRSYFCADSEGFYSDYFQIYFAPGEHSISLSGVRESLVLGAIDLVPATSTITYKDYVAQYEKVAGSHKYGSSVVRLEAETPFAVSDTSVYAGNDRSSAINSPTSATAQYYNVLGREGYGSMGQWAAYEFTVDDDGFYSFAMRYHQTELEGMFVSRAIKLWSDDGAYGLADGTPTLPFAEATSARFDYDKSWQVETLNDGENNFEFYFKKGVTYRVYFEVSLGHLAEIIGKVQSSLSTINDCYLSILKLTGASPDEYRNYNFTQVMPGTVRNLLLESINLYKVSEDLQKICGTTGSHIATLDRVAFLLNRMGSDESEIAPNLSNLKSYIGTLGTWINSSKSQLLTIDYLAVQPVNAELPAAGASIWQSMGFEFKSFFASFVVDYNAMGVTDGVECDTTLEVWLATGRDQSLIWRNMIDNQFTPKEQIAVQLKLVAAGTLLPSVLAGRGPDVYIGLDSSSTINYAIRSAILPVEKYAGFDERLGYDTYDEDTNTYYMDGVKIPTNEVYFNNANMVQLSLYGRSYGVPETASFPMLFYRKDILAEMGVSVPKTWDELLSIAPQFQANNMEIGLGYAASINIFIYQNGGSLWRYEDNQIYEEKYAGAHIGLDSDEALGAFRYLTRLYTDYSFPVTFDAANRFRTGEMPLVIADYCGTYNQLVVFASEISGLWEFAAMPGTVRTDKNGKEIVDSRSVATVSAVVMLEGCENKEDAWEFMKWQCGADVQAQYGNQMVALVGPAAKYATANMQALKDLSWSTSEYNALMEQFELLAAVPNYPGSYIIARYTNFAFLDAVNDGADAVESLQSYITTINKELARKRAEFDGKVFADGSTFDVPVLDIGQKPPQKQ